MNAYLINVENGQGDILSLLKVMSNELGIDTNRTNNYGKGDIEGRPRKSGPRLMTRDQATQTVPRGKL